MWGRQARELAIHLEDAERRRLQEEGVPRARMPARMAEYRRSRAFRYHRVII
jgi:hypothetical protein